MGKGKDSYHFSEEVIMTLMDPIFTKGIKNRDAIKSMVLNIFSSTNIETLIDIIHKKTKYAELYQGCYVSVVPPKYWKGQDYEEDVLKDHGLLAENGNLYGQVTADGSWDKDKFNPYHYNFKIDIFLLKETKGLWVLDVKEEELHASEIEPLANKESIKHFKVKSLK